MNREQLSDAIGRLEESVVAEVMVSRRRRRPWWVAAVAVAACVSLVVGMVAVWPLLELRVTRPSIDDGGGNTTTTSKPTDATDRQPTNTVGTPELTIPAALAKPQYPEMAKRPVDYDTDPEGFDLWRDDVFAQREQVKGHSGGMTDFYAETMAQFLAGEAGQNRIYSPLNVYLALAMLAETAEGESRRQILDLLGVSDLTALREKCNGLWNGVYMNDGAVTSVPANSLWLADGDRWQYDEDTVNALTEHYYASVFEGEMGSKEYDAALQDWINRQTDNLLKEQADGLTLDPATVLALVSTINYRAKWVDEFNPEKSEEGVFYAASGEVPCTYMKRQGMEMAFFGDRFTGLSLGLDDGAYQMYFFLPDKGVSVDSLIADKQALQVMQQGTASGLAKYLLVDMTIPQFDVVSDQDLAKGLKALGVTDVFDAEKSDFGGILTEQSDPVWVSQMPHAARVSIDEEGVTAAAYTVMMLCGTGAPQETLEFVLDRPFMFAITGPGNTILFTGVVEQP